MCTPNYIEEEKGEMTQEGDAVLYLDGLSLTVVYRADDTMNQGSWGHPGVGFQVGTS